MPFNCHRGYSFGLDHGGLMADRIDHGEHKFVAAGRRFGGDFNCRNQNDPWTGRPTAGVLIRAGHRRDVRTASALD